MRSALARPAAMVVAGVAAACALLDGYLALLTVAAARRRPTAGGRRITEDGGGHRFAVLVPAHDEAAGIASTVDSVVTQRYPRDLCEVHVVADNCTDATALVAGRHGAVVHERHAPDAPGKGPALAWLVERIERRGTPPDIYVVLDADTLMDRDFVVTLDRCVTSDTVAWQGYYTVRDPGASTTTSLRHAALVLRHYVRPLGRTALGGSCGLFGNGMAFRREVLSARKFSDHLTEDVELQLELLLDGHLVGFVPDAVVAAEMPTTLTAARSQNERWERGRLDLARRFVPQLVGQAVQPRTSHRLACADAALDQLVPPLSVLATATLAGLGGAIATRALFGKPAGRAGLVLGAGASTGLAVHVVGGLRVARVPASVYRGLLHAPRLVAWKVGLWLRMAVRPGQVGWVRTARNRTGAPR